MSVSRREILAGGALAAGVGWAGAAGAAPRRSIARLADLTAPRTFTYPDDAAPAVLFKLGAPVEDGVGPDRDVVAYSAVCTHLGCVVQARDGRLVCPCHGSMFDPAAGGRCYQGPASTAIPRIRLEFDGDEVFAVGVDGVVWGRTGAERS